MWWSVGVVAFRLVRYIGGAFEMWQIFIYAYAFDSIKSMGWNKSWSYRSTCSHFCLAALDAANRRNRT